ncbi:MAG TPA: DedA family protein [Gemmatimonadaceae bacterium]|jgi:membrane protein DedA with SNARE-associated domain
MGLPLPGEIILLTAGALAAQGELNVAGVAIAAFVGTIAGGTGGYWIGRTGGATLVRRYGRWAGITEAREKTVRAFFESHGARTILLARFVAILRMIASVIAGSVAMPFGIFSLCNAIGGLIWAVAFTALGYFFGSHLHQLEHYLRGGSFTLLALLLIVWVAVAYYRRRRSNRRANSNGRIV